MNVVLNQAYNLLQKGFWFVSFKAWVNINNISNTTPEMTCSVVCRRQSKSALSLLVIACCRCFLKTGLL